MTRTDTHSPTNFDPADYRDVGYFDAHPEEGGSWMSREADDEIEDYFDGNYTNRNRCDHCGAGPLRYGVVYKHLPTGLGVVVGMACAGKLALSSRSQLEAKALIAEAVREAKVNDYMQTITDEQREAIEFAEAVATTPYLDEAGNNIFRPLFPAVRGETVSFVSDLNHKLHRYGSLSEKQVGALIKIKARNDEFLGKNAAERAALTTPLAEGRYEITGEIVSTKWVESDFGGAMKMLVKMADGNKVYGTMPNSLRGIPTDEAHTYVNTEKGDTVTFTAAVERSKDDEHFGFFKRPTKASVEFAAPVAS